MLRIITKFIATTFRECCRTIGSVISTKGRNLFSTKVKDLHQRRTSLSRGLLRNDNLLVVQQTLKVLTVI